MAPPKIVFLGTGGDSVVVGKNMRSAGGIIVEIEDNQFHIDPGPGALVRASECKINLRNNIAVLVSSNHLNHANDINAVISAMTLGGLDKKGVLVAARSVFEEEGEMSPMLNKFFRNYLEKDIIFERGKKIAINDIEIKAAFADHTDKTSVGFIFHTPHFSLGYTSDTNYSDELIEEYKELDAIIINCVSPSGINKEGELNSEDAVKLITGAKPKLAIITHFGIKMLDSDPINEARQMQRKTGINVIAAKEGAVIFPLSYSVEGRQKFSPFSGFNK